MNKILFLILGALATSCKTTKPIEPVSDGLTPNQRWAIHAEEMRKKGGITLILEDLYPFVDD